MYIANVHIENFRNFLTIDIPLKPFTLIVGKWKCSSPLVLAYLLRPRDIVVILRIIQKECKKRNLDNPDINIISSSDLISEYTHYYTDQIVTY